MNTLIQDVKYAWRAVLAKPAFALLAVTTLALGIAASTAVFTLLDALVFRPIRVHQPNRLVQLAAIDQRGRPGYLSLAALNLIEREQLFDSVCAFVTPQSTVDMNGRVGPIAALALSADCFRTFRISPAAGRLLRPEDSRPGAPNVVVLSYDVWQREFDGRADAIGTIVRIEGEPFTVIGVTERSFDGVQAGFPSRLMMPLEPKSFLPAPLRPSLYAANVFARLRDGTSLEQIADRLQVIWPGVLDRSLPDGLDARGRSAWLASRVSVTSAATGLDSTVRSRF